MEESEAPRPIELCTPPPQSDQPNENVERALSGLEALRERVRANADLSQRLRDLEASVNDIRRQSAAVPPIDPQVRSAVQKINARIEKLEQMTQGLLEALTVINSKQSDMERLLAAFSQITDGV